MAVEFIQRNIREGRTPTPADADEGCTIKLLGNACLNSKRAKLHSGELSQLSFADYLKTGTMLADHFGRSRRIDDLRPDDFEALRGKRPRGWARESDRNDAPLAEYAPHFANPSPSPGWIETFTPKL